MRRQSVSGDGAFWNERERTPVTVPFTYAKAGSPLRSAPALQIRAYRYHATTPFRPRQDNALRHMECAGRALAATALSGTSANELP